MLEKFQISVSWWQEIWGEKENLKYVYNLTLKLKLALAFKLNKWDGRSNGFELFC